MDIFGLSITRTKRANTLSAVDGYNRGWWPLLREASTGSWQRNEEARLDNVSAHYAVFSCISLIATDIGKMRLRLVAQDSDGIWNETENPAWSPVLRKPNHYQTRQRFFEWWMVSKLSQGNTYALKRRDARGIVNALYILDPCRVRPFVSPDGSVFYELKSDILSGLQQDIVMVPASEIIHDVYVPLFHPLVGVTPIYACGLAALQGLKIQNNSTNLFSNGSNPGGILVTPEFIAKDKARELKELWEDQYGGADNAGKVAVLGGGMKFEQMTMKATDAQLIEQLKWTAEAVCTAYRVPPHKICVGQMPNYNNVEALDRQYFGQCIQEKSEGLEGLLDEGLDLPRPFGTEFNTDDLFSMDVATLIKSEKDASGLKTVNESRKRLNLKPIEGGSTVYLQQQDTAIEAIARRDEQSATVDPQPAPPAAPPPTAAEDAKSIETMLMARMLPLMQKNAQVGAVHAA